MLHRPLDHGGYVIDTVRNPTRLATAAIVALFVWLASEMGFAGGSFMEMRALTALDPTTTMTTFSAPPELDDLVGPLGIVAIVYTAGSLVASILVLMWMYRVIRNAHALSQWMTASPGWTIGFFFIPIANFWKPFKGVREAWQVSFNPSDPDAVAIPPLLRWWWGVWLVSTIVGNLSLRWSLGIETVADQILVDRFSILIAIVDIPLTLILVAVIRRLSAAQVSVGLQMNA